MGDAPQAPGDQQISAYPEHQTPIHTMEMEELQAKTLTAPGERSNGAPFYSQFDAFPNVARAPNQHGNPYAGYQPQQPVHRLDMSSLGSALPDAFTASTPLRGYSQQAPPIAHGMPVQQQNPNIRPQYASQPYPSNMTMHVHMPRVQAHSQPFGPHYYGSYTVAPSQMSMHSHVQPVAGYPTIPGPSYGKPEAVFPQAYSGPVGQPPVAESTPSYPRGPPRKPKQSGNALWVGNLPPGTTISALKDHFSREATKDIESLFLISKSNCAFVNYRTEAACTAAMARFHDSRFQGVRLVCRLRRGTPNGGSVSSTPDSISPSVSNGSKSKSPTQQTFKRASDSIIVASSSSQSPKKDVHRDLSDGVDGLDGVDGVDGVDGIDGIDGVDGTDGADGVDGSTSPRVPEKYFVVKSLTLQDLEASVRNGIWATQSHNEAALNKAYKTADNVYLIFSANKSGEYFGYARMLSPIAFEPVLMPAKSQAESREPDDGPKSIPTPATQWAPRGRIVDDSARGTIFWEADNPELEDGVDGIAMEQPQEKEATGSKQAQEWGKPFKIEWLSTQRLPFYRTRGLRNPWNENREIKIARDGTEIEPSIGQRLVHMFHHAVLPPRGVPPMPPVTMSPMTPHFPI